MYHKKKNTKNWIRRTDQKVSLVLLLLFILTLSCSHLALYSQKKHFVHSSCPNKIHCVLWSFVSMSCQLHEWHLAVRDKTMSVLIFLTLPSVIHCTKQLLPKRLLNQRAWWMRVQTLLMFTETSEKDYL